MFSKPWIYVHNTFITVTFESYRTCKKIGDYTLNALNGQIADPFFAALYATLLPFVTNFNSLYAAWLQQMGMQKSKTNTLTVLLKTLQSEKIERWDIQIQAQYPQSSSEYIALLPNRRGPFQHGSQEDRIAAVSAFSGALTGIVGLAALKTDVDSFLADLQSSFNVQKANLSQTNINSTDLEAARIAVCVELYGTLGLLMNHFKANPIDADNYFDTETIRNHEQTLFKSNIDGGEQKLALTHTFEAGEEVRLVNRGNTVLKFALCLEANDAISSPMVEVPAMDEVIIPADALGDVLTQRFLKVQNMSSTEAGKYTVMLL